MKRPITIGAVFVLTGAVGAVYFSLLLTGIVLLMESGILIYYCRRNMLHHLYVYYLLVCAGVGFIICLQTSNQIQHSSYETTLEQNNGENGVIQGQVCAVVRKNGYVQLQLKKCTIKINEESGDSGSASSCEMILNNVGVLVSTTAFSGNVGDIVSVEGKIQCFDRPRNQGEFNSRQYYHSIGMDYSCKGKNCMIIKSEKSQLRREISLFQDRIQGIFEEITDSKKAGILSSVVLGDKQNLDSDVKKMYQTSGIAHLLAISGLHISIIGMTLYRLLRKFLSFFPSAILGICVMMMYLMMTGNGISAFRAVMMFILAVTAEVVGRTYDFKTAMAVAGILLIFEDGRVIMNSGFILSFSALIGIGWIFPVVSEGLNCFKKKSWKGKFLDGVFVSISIQISTLPIILQSYYQVPVYGFLLNLIVIPLMSLVMISGILAGLAGIFSILVATFFMGTSNYILDLYEWLCLLYKKIPGGVWIAGKPSETSIVIYISIVTFCLFLISRKKSLYVRIVTGGMLLAGIVQMKCVPQSELMVNMIDVGQGDSILVRTEKNQNYLFDGGSTDVKNVGTKRILPYLKSQGISELEYVFISHSDTDHMNGILEILEEEDSAFVIKQIVLPDIEKKELDENYQKIISTANKYGVNVAYSIENDTLKDESGLEITCIHPEEYYAYESANDYSAVYLLQYENFKMLFTGDAEEKAEKAMINHMNTNMLCDVNVLKAGHHGSSSSSSSAFLTVVNPEVALISCGVNNSYGHPHEQTMDHLGEISCRTYITSQIGAIQILSDGKTYKVQSFLQTK